MAILAIVVVGLLFGVVMPWTRATFDALEHQEIERNVARAENAIRAELQSLESTANDWGAWDDTAAFVQGAAPDYIAMNLFPSTFDNLRLNFMAFFDASGDLVLARGHDLETSEELVLASGLLDALSQAIRPSSGYDSAKGGSALLDLRGGFGLVAFHPILNSLHELPIVGTVGLGRILTPEAVDRLGTQLELPLEIASLSAAALPPAAREELAGAAGTTVWHVASRQVGGATLWTDTGGSPAVLSVVLPRTTYLLGQRTLSYLIGALLAMLVVLGSGFLLFLQVRVLSRTSRLSADVSRIAASNDRTERVEVRGRDELASLQREINGMLSSIEASNEALERSERRYHNLFESSPDPINITTLDGAFVDVNQAFVHLFGYTKPEIMATSVAAFYVDSEDRAAFRSAIEHVGRVVGFPVTLRKKDGKTVRCLITSALEESADGTGRIYQGIIRDVSELLRQQEELEYLATHDPLTGLLTRSALDEVLKLEIARAARNLERLAVFYLDLDRFKEVNDALGHAAGDRLLQDVAGRLRDSLRASDAVARLGGDEFVALLPGIDGPHDAELAADKVLHALRRAFRLNDRQHGLSVSIGIALCPDDGDTPTHLLQKADAAMYSVKTQGRDGWCRFGRDRTPLSKN